MTKEGIIDGMIEQQTSSLKRRVNLKQEEAADDSTSWETFDTSATCYYKYIYYILCIYDYKTESLKITWWAAKGSAWFQNKSTWQRWENEPEWMNKMSDCRIHERIVTFSATRGFVNGSFWHEENEALGNRGGKYELKKGQKGTKQTGNERMEDGNMGGRYKSVLSDENAALLSAKYTKSFSTRI